MGGRGSKTAFGTVPTIEEPLEQPSQYNRHAFFEDDVATNSSSSNSLCLSGGSNHSLQITPTTTNKKSFYTNFKTSKKHPSSSSSSTATRRQQQHHHKTTQQQRQIEQQQATEAVFTILNCCHQVTLAGLVELKSAIYKDDDDDDNNYDDDDETSHFTTLWPDFFRWIHLQQSMEYGADLAKGIFLTLDEYGHNLATNRGLYDAYEEVSPIQTKLDYLITQRPNHRQDIQSLFQEFESIHRNHLQKLSQCFEEIKSWENTHKQHNNSSKRRKTVPSLCTLFQKDIMPALGSDEAHFVQYTCQVLEARYPVATENNEESFALLPEASSFRTRRHSAGNILSSMNVIRFGYALWMVSTLNQWKLRKRLMDEVVPPHIMQLLEEQIVMHNHSPPSHGGGGRLSSKLGHSSISFLRSPSSSTSTTSLSMSTTDSEFFL